MTTFSNLAIDVFHELTRVRTHPASFADDMEKYLEQYKANNAFHRPNAVPLITREGREACIEAINFLREQQPIESLNYSDGLSRAAQFLVNDTGSKGIIGHIASDESRFQERVERFGKWSEALAEALDYGSVTGFEVVCSFIVDDGLPTRPHRNAIMNRKFKCVGIGSGPHSQYKSMVAIIFAGDFNDDSTAPEIQEPTGEIPTVPEVGDWLEGAVKMTCEVRSGVEDGKQVKKLKKYWEMSDGSTQITEDMIEL